MTTQNCNDETASVAKSVMAGYVAGISGVLIGFPFDSAKTWLQADTHLFTPLQRVSSSPTTTSWRHKPAVTRQRTAGLTTAASPSRVVSWRALYSGVCCPLLTVGIAQSANFAIFDALKRTLHKHQHPNAPANDYLHRASIQTVAVASGASGAIVAFFTKPFIVIKTKQQLMTWDFRRAFLDTLRPSRGLSGFYVGLGPHLIMESFGRGIYFATYESMKKCVSGFRENNNNNLPQRASLQERILCAATSGIVSCAIMFPLDSLRSRLIASSLSGGTTEPLALAAAMCREDACFRSFFRGFGVTVLRAGPVAAAVLPIYDLTLEWLNHQM